MAECAFCDHTGKLTAEHITSQWLNSLFKGPARAWFGVDEAEGKPFRTDGVDFKARVVCENCNHTWMSDIEGESKRVVTPLITGERQVAITPEVARSIAVYAFKTAVIIDHARRDRTPFFSRRIRHAFRRSRFIPNFVYMWMSPFAEHRDVLRFKSVYNEGTAPTGHYLNMYTCTCAFGHFAFQVLAFYQSGNATLQSNERFNQIAVPFWPQLAPNYVWPRVPMLTADSDFADFAMRWRNITIFND